MEYSAQIYTSTNLNLEKEVIDIIKAGQELQRPALTVSDDILNNYFITPFSLKNGTLNSEKNIIAPFQA